MAKIIFFGEDAFSNVVVQSLILKHEVVAIVTPLYNNLIYKRLEATAITNNIEFIREKDINSQNVVDKISAHNPDLIVVAHFEKLLKKPLLDIPRLGSINLHPSLLPKYRGMSPQHWPIINGEKQTGISIHYIDSGVDTGNIILQRTIELTDTMYVSDLQKKWLEHYKDIMVEAVSMVLLGEKGTRQIIDDNEPYYGRLKEKDCRINFGKSVQEVYRLIRGVSFPYQGAFFEQNKKKIIIFKADIVSDQPIGETAKFTDNQFLSFKDGTIKITKSNII